jgi:molybdate transport system substrate-binding protein
MKRRLLSAFLVGVLAVGLIGCSGGKVASDPGGNLEFQGESLLVYSGAGLSKAMDEIGQVFEANYGATIQLNYGGCAQLLGQMEINSTGDVFVGGSMNDADIALEKGFTEECLEVVYHIPAIAVPKGNPAGITSLEDMAKPGMKLILGDTLSNAIGKKGEKIFDKKGLLEKIDANVVARAVTVNEIITQISLGQGDAGLVWADNGVGNSDIEIIEIPIEQNLMDKVPACVLSFTEKEELAQLFVDFLMSEEGKAIFMKHGFQEI